MLHSNEKVQVKLFAGLIITSEIRMHLNISIFWKQAQIDRTGLSSALIEVHHEGQDYLGKFLMQPELTVKDLHSIQDEIRNVLKLYCPKLDTDLITIFLFPQLFIK